MLENVLSLLGMIFVLIVVLIGAYYTTRWTATRMGGMSGFGGAGQKLAMVYRVPLGKDQQLMVVKVANRHILIGSTPNQITFLTELTAAESEEFFSENASVPRGETVKFAQILQAMREHKNSDDENDPRKE